jgi:hypothetical protein
MSDVVFILGAGASKQAGAPLMSEFLPASRDLLSRGLAGDSEQSFLNVFKAIGNLQIVHSKCDIDLQNVESVFAALEMGKTLNKFPWGDTPKDMDNLIQDLTSVIAKTIEQTLLFPVEPQGVIKDPPPYRGLSDLISFLRQQPKQRRSVCVITFNYDVAVDRALGAHGLNPDYCLTDSEPTTGVRLLKLHGSLNWIYCRTCCGVHVLDILPKKAEDLYADGVIPRDHPSVPMPIQKWLQELECCAPLPRQPLIVPPTWSKSEYHGVMPTVWRAAAEELEDAEHIFVIGYSFPQSDAFFHHLYGLGSVGERPLRRFWVFNPDEEEVKGRFRQLLGRGAERVFEYRPVTFEKAISELWHAFE